MLYSYGTTVVYVVHCWQKRHYAAHDYTLYSQYLSAYKCLDSSERKYSTLNLYRDGMLVEDAFSVGGHTE